MERVVSQQFLLPIFPWFLEKFKPWTARKAVIQSLYLGRNPPMFTDIRVVRQSTEDDHLVLEIGMNFLSADDMDARMAVQLRKRVGFGITANMHITGMHVEGKVLVGVRFLRQWPFIGRVRVCFVEPPYFQMTVKPLFGHGLDVTELPGISGWLDRILDVAFGQTLVEPNMLVIDLEKFASESTENWFSVDEKPPIAHARVEILEGADMKPSDPNGLADPYVKGHLGPYRFQTKIHKKTLNPKWHEEFKIPITSWEALNLLSLQVRDKDPIFDDTLGDCSISINKLRGGQRHDIWISLKNIKTGRIHIAVTVLGEENEKVHNDEEEQCGTPIDKASTPRSSFSSRTNNESESSDELRKMSDEFEPVEIEGSDKPDVWVHRPGSDIASTWEPRKGRPRCQDSKIQRENEACSDSPRSSVSESQRSDSSAEEPMSGKSHRHLRKVKKGLGKLAGAVFHRSPKNETDDEPSPCVTPHPNIRPVGESRVSVTYVVDQDPGSSRKGTVTDEQQHSSPEREDPNSPTKRHLRKKAAHMVKHAGKTTAHNLKSMFSKKSLEKSKEEYQNDEEGDVVAMKIDGVAADPPVLNNDAVDLQESAADSKDNER
ncbi:unnamed protein product [Urochloa humidicola]